MGRREGWKWEDGRDGNVKTGGWKWEDGGGGLKWEDGTGGHRKTSGVQMETFAYQLNTYIICPPDYLKRFIFYCEYYTFLIFIKLF